MIKKEKLLKHFGNELKKIRKSFGETQEEFVRKIGISVSTLMRAENGMSLNAIYFCNFFEPQKTTEVLVEYIFNGKLNRIYES